ncbi:hypothetical protein KEJ39_02765 [Candidatus Bathyarchaeota archaeon]|nr:hypothetical protein [Candidatus Bathyarchaeota archaeon]
MVIQQTSEKCVDCGRRTSRNLKYCDVCRKVHFISALRNIRHESLSRTVINPPLSKPGRDGAAGLEHERGRDFAERLGGAAALPQRLTRRTASSPRI